jgi:hypothetical protein
MFRLEIKTDNDAFQSRGLGAWSDAVTTAAPEVARILRELADSFDSGRVGSGGTLRDINGNCVGDWGWCNPKCQHELIVE